MYTCLRQVIQISQVDKNDGVSALWFKKEVALQDFH